jgi:hypothetical protein
MRRLISACIALAVAGALLVAACGTGGHESPESSGEYVHLRGALPWGVVGDTPPHSLEIAGYVGYCVGDPKPRVVVERIEYRGTRVLIRLGVQKRVLPEEKGTVCYGVDKSVSTTVMLKKNLNEVEVFDRGFRPPLRRWPLDPGQTD